MCFSGERAGEDAYAADPLMLDGRWICGPPPLSSPDPEPESRFSFPAPIFVGRERYSSTELLLSTV